MSRVLVIGMPRSGTTWLGKLLDAHPNVLYRHEPDSDIYAPIPYLVPKSEWERYRSIAVAHFDKLVASRTLRAVGVRPYFKKDFRGSFAEIARRGLMMGIRGAEMFPPLRTVAPKVNIPDFSRRSDREDIVFVVKSVIAPGRAGLYVEALPDVPFVLILRHPCGYVASQLRGRRLGALAGDIPINAMTTTEQARKRNLTVTAFEGMDFVEQATWLWVLFNEKMLQETKGKKNCMVIRYEDLCEKTVQTLRKIYDFAGLTFLKQTEAFLNASSQEDNRSSHYYGLFRDPTHAANRWRTELDPKDIERIENIASQSVPGCYYL